MGLLRDGGLSIGLKIGRYVLGMGSAVLLNWLMPIHEYGIYAYVLSIATLLALAGESGMPPLVVRELSQARVEGDKPRIRGLVLFANATVVVLSLLIAAVTMIVLFWLRDRVSPELALSLTIALPALLLGSLANTRAGILRALDSPVMSQVPELLVRPAALILMAGIFYLIIQRPLTAAEGTGAFLASSAISFVCGTVMLVGAYRRKVGPGPRSFRTWKWLKALLPFSAIYFLQSTLGQMSILILGIFAPPAEVALFRIAVLAADFAIFPVLALSTVITSDVARLHHRGEKRELELLISRANRMNVAAAVVITLGLIVLGPLALHLGFGPEYRNAYLPMCIIAVGHVGSTTVAFVVTLANMANEERLTIYGAVLGITLTAVLGLLLSPIYGALGAAIASAVSAVTWRFAMAIWLRFKLGVRPWAFKWTVDRIDLGKLKRLVRR